MNEQQLAEIRQRVERATQGPWTVGVSTSWDWPVFRIRDMEGPTDAEIEADRELIAHAQPDILALLDEIEHLRKALRPIPFTERLPEHKQETLQWNGRYWVQRAWYDYDGMGKVFTHWLPLPPGPESEHDSA